MFKCIGCDQIIDWDGHSPFAYKCECGASVLYDTETGIFSPPFSVVHGLRTGQPRIHLDDIVGESNFISELKETLITFLLDHNFIWMRDCEYCTNDGTYQRRIERQKYLALKEVEYIIRTTGS